jgi:diguanylate cyclase (GGDEF)-like protein
MVVREMGAMIRQCLRKQDLGGLYGGDETILLFPDLPMNDALPIAEAIRETIAARAFEHQGHAFKVTISQGLAEFPAHGETVEKLIAAADHALYDAKRAGRNCVCCAEPSETPQA